MSQSEIMNEPIPKRVKVTWFQDQDKFTIFLKKGKSLYWLVTNPEIARAVLVQLLRVAAQAMPALKWLSENSSNKNKGVRNYVN